MPLPHVLRPWCWVAALVCACGGDDGGTGATTNVQDTSVAGGAPTVTITSPSAGQVFQLGDPVLVLARVEDDRDSGEALDVTIVSSRDRELATLAPNAAGFVTFETSSLSAGAHTLTVAAVDSEGRSAASDVTITVNERPSGSVTIAPAAPRTGDDLVANATFTDDGDDALTIRWRWFVDGDESAVQTPTVPSASTSKGEVWRVVATATDALGQADQAEASVTIGNTAPSCASAIMLPSVGTTSTTFGCSCFDRRDPDEGDPRHDRCVFKDGDRVLGSGDGCSLDPSLTTRDMLLTCTLTPSDGDDDGAPVTSATISVLDTEPTRPEIALSPTEGTVLTSFTCAVTTPSTDADGDALTVETTWLVNGHANPGTSTTEVVPHGRLVSDADGKPVRGGDTIACRVVSFDGVARSSAADSVAVTLANSPPTGGSVVITPTSPDENSALSCVATGAVDVDGDVITWTYGWTIDGDEIAGAVDATLPASALSAGDEVSCWAIPGDGALAGTRVDAKSDVTIANATPSTPVVEVLAPLGGDGTVTCHVATPATDKEPLTQTFYWQINGGLEFAGGPTLDDDDVAPCNIVRCRLVVDDGTTQVGSAPAELTLPVGSCADDNACTDHACSSEGSCVTTNGTGACNDLDPCTTGDACLGGACIGVAKECDDDQLCTTDSCNPATGQCQFVTNPNACADTNPCTRDTCSVAANGGLGGCVFEPLTGDACDADGDGCTQGDACESGSCEPGPAFDCTTGVDPGELACQTFVCETTSATTFTCAAVRYDETVACDDGSYCTIGDRCDGEGACASGAPRACSIGLGQCRFGVCDEDVDACAVSDRDDGTRCDFDGDGCTVDDACADGICRKGAAADCSEVADGCNAGLCVADDADDYTCASEPLDPGTACADDDLCTVETTCAIDPGTGLGVCGGGAARDCEAEAAATPGYTPNPCRPFACDPTAGCFQTTLATGTPCDDGDACTLEDACDAFGRCRGGANACIEEQLNLTNVDRAPAIEPVVDGRYAVVWHLSGASPQLRVTDAYGSRENEQRGVSSSFFPTPSDGVDALLGMSRDPATGDFLVLAESGGCWLGGDCAANICGRCERLQHVLAQRFSADGALLAEMPVQTIRGTRRCREHSLSVGAWTRAFTWSDGSHGVVVAPQYAWQANEGNVPDPAQGTLLYRRLMADLTPLDAAGTPCTVDQFPVGGPCPTVITRANPGFPYHTTPQMGCGFTTLALSGGAERDRFTQWDAEPMVGTDGFVTVWREADHDLRANRFAREGTAEGAIAVVTGDTTIEDVEVVPLVDFSYVVVYERLTAANTRELAARRVLDPPGTGGFVDLALVPATPGLELGEAKRLSDNSWIVLWSEDGSTAGTTTVWARRFAIDGAPLTEETRVDTGVGAGVVEPRLTVVDGDDVVLAYRKDTTLYTRRLSKLLAPRPGRPERTPVQVPQLDQHQPAGAADGGEHVLVAWTHTASGATGQEIHTRAFGAGGAPLGEVTTLNTTAAGAQSSPAVAGAGGRWVVAWTSAAQDGSGLGVYARVRERASGATTAEVALAPSDLRAGDQDLPSVAMRADGRWVAAWRTPGAVRARAFMPDGAPLDDGAAAWSLDGGTAGAPLVTLAPDGEGFILGHHVASPSPAIIRLVRLGEDGAPIGDAVEIARVRPDGGAEPTGTEHTNVALAAAGGDALMACWQTTDGNSLRCQRFDASLVPAASPMSPVPSPAGALRDPALATLSSGDVLLAYTVASGLDGSDAAVQYVRIADDGLVDGPRVVGNRHRPLAQSAPFIAPIPGAGDRFFLGWQSQDQDASGLGVYFRALDLLLYP